MVSALSVFKSAKLVWKFGFGGVFGSGGVVWKAGGGAIVSFSCGFMKKDAARRPQVKRNYCRFKARPAFSFVSFSAFTCFIIAL